jgi:hypothetical protein
MNCKIIQDNCSFKKKSVALVTSQIDNFSPSDHIMNFFLSTTVLSKNQQSDLATFLIQKLDGISGKFGFNNRLIDKTFTSFSGKF